jgi:hypothetical protein
MNTRRRFFVSSCSPSREWERLFTSLKAMNSAQQAFQQNDQCLISLAKTTRVLPQFAEIIEDSDKFI